MLFSALVDADYLDTESHFDPKKAEDRGDYPTLGELWSRFDDTYRSRFSTNLGRELNTIRQDVHDACLSTAEHEPGAFSLTVPTGGGKTLASLGFALRHALKWGLDRVIVVIPYTSIIEQTADVFREFLGPDAVLEHHSATQDEPGADYAVSRELASENWDAPIIVTTAVQFFESLFANLPSRCRKVHNVAGSVVIVDETQTLPLGLLRPTFEVIASLIRNYQVSFLFTTATQPAYQGFTDLPIREIMPDPSRLARNLRRVTWERLDEPLSWDEVAVRMRTCEQAMAVVNTRADARSLYSTLPATSRLHLSTNLCGAHRRAVLGEVKRRLQAGEPCLLATTQLVEAGVDLDFPSVLRARAPLEALVQAAGRCNREGRQERGTVLIFDPSEGGLPRGSYETATQATDVFLRAEPDTEIDDPEAQRRYFAQLYQACDLDAKSISHLRESFEFPSVAKAYRLIADDSVAVAVSWQKGQELLDQLRGSSWVSRADWRRLQPYLVSLRSHEFRRAQEAGLCGEVVAASGLWRWEGGYDPYIGLQWDFDTLIF
jgi:CRISPR-associated endonuclease/helicase Cas3